MPSSSTSRRSYGTGSLFVRVDAGGREHWYGQWRIDGRQIKRKVGVKRAPGTRDGLTRAHAERELRRFIDELAAEPQVEEITLGEAGRRHVERLELLGRKHSTLMDYESTLRVHLVPYFGDVQLSRSRRQGSSATSRSSCAAAGRRRASATTSGCCTASWRWVRSAAGC